MAKNEKKHTGSECKNSLFLENEITLRIYREMLHCIGFDRKKVKYGKFYEWRNRFIIGTLSNSIVWDKLVGLKLAMTHTFQSGDTMFYLTDAGFEFVARFENIIIVREDEK